MKTLVIRLTVGLIGAISVVLTAASLPAGEYPGQIQRTSAANYSGSYCPECESGYGYGDGYCDHCNGGRGRTRISAKSWARPPVLPPVQRHQKVYTRYWADHVTRNSGSAVRTAPAPSYPMIHTPTDTTQLGYSYVHVPYFYFRPEMLPPAPGPSWGTARLVHGSSYSSYDSSGYASPAESHGHEVAPTPIQNPAPAAPANAPAARPEPIPVQGNPEASNYAPPTPAPQPSQYFTGSKS